MSIICLGETYDYCVSVAEDIIWITCSKYMEIKNSGHNIAWWKLISSLISNRLND